MSTSLFRIAFVGVFLMSNLSACSSARYRGPVSDHFDGERFFSPYGLKPKGFWAVMKWSLEGGRSEWPASVENRGTPQLPESIEPHSIYLTFVNHATFLIQYQNLNILTDPLWSERASPVSFAGPKRVRPPGLAYEKLPKIDLVVISHNHYDHFDQPTIERLVKDHNPLFIVALGDGRLLEKIRGARFIELDWWQSHEVNESFKVHFLPAQHWSARGVFDRNRSLWGSYYLESQKGPRIYFAGDSGYAPHFKEIAAKFSEIDLALLPIGAYEPRWIMKDQHMNPEEAVVAHQELKAKQSVGMHFGTIQMTNEAIDAPIHDLAKAREAANLKKQDFDVLDEGETRRFDRVGK